MKLTHETLIQTNPCQILLPRFTVSQIMRNDQQVSFRIFFTANHLTFSKDDYLVVKYAIPGPDGLPMTDGDGHVKFYRPDKPPSDKDNKNRIIFGSLKLKSKGTRGSSKYHIEWKDGTVSDVVVPEQKSHTHLQRQRILDSMTDSEKSLAEDTLSNAVREDSSSGTITDNEQLLLNASRVMNTKVPGPGAIAENIRAINAKRDETYDNVLNSRDGTPTGTAPPTMPMDSSKISYIHTTPDGKVFYATEPTYEYGPPRPDQPDPDGTAGENTEISVAIPILSGQGSYNSVDSPPSSNPQLIDTQQVLTADDLNSSVIHNAGFNVLSSIGIHVTDDNQFEIPEVEQDDIVTSENVTLTSVYEGSMIKSEDENFERLNKETKKAIRYVTSSKIRNKPVQGAMGLTEVHQLTDGDIPESEITDPDRVDSNPTDDPPTVSGQEDIIDPDLSTESGQEGSIGYGLQPKTGQSKLRKTYVLGKEPRESDDLEEGLEDVDGTIRPDTPAGEDGGPAGEDMGDPEALVPPPRPPRPLDHLRPFKCHLAPGYDVVTGDLVWKVRLGYPGFYDTFDDYVSFFTDAICKRVDEEVRCKTGYRVSVSKAEIIDKTLMVAQQRLYFRSNPGYVHCYWDHCSPRLRRIFQPPYYFRNHYSRHLYWYLVCGTASNTSIADDTFKILIARHAFIDRAEEVVVCSHAPTTIPGNSFFNPMWVEIRDENDELYPLQVPYILEWTFSPIKPA